MAGGIKVYFPYPKKGERLNNGKIYNLDRENWREMVSSGIVLVDFYAEWCPPCLKIEPILEKIAKEYESKIKVCRFNVDEDDEIPRKYYVQILPTLFLFKDGEVVSGIEGMANPASIKKIIESIL